VNQQALDILQHFETFSLQELEAANLLERKDFKYIFRAADLPSILDAMKPYYSAMKIKEFLYTDYITDYYDTNDFDFYLQHHNGHLNRYKVRLRTYVQSALHFYEVKFKNNKNWTSKHRERIASSSVDINTFTKDISPKPLEQKLRVQYARITLLSKNGTEKLTLDLDLKFSHNGTEKDFSHVCIAEVKSKTHHPYVFRQEIKRLGYRSMGLSKYCFGITQLHPQLKANNFKKAIINLRKLYA
jgi:hypothetical protein